MNPDERSAAEQYSRAAIVEHPFYAEMVLAHVRIYKVCLSNSSPLFLLWST